MFWECICRTVSDTLLGCLLILSQYDWQQTGHRLFAQFITAVQAKTQLKFPGLVNYLVNDHVLENLSYMTIKNPHLKLIICDERWVVYVLPVNFRVYSFLELVQSKQVPNKWSKNITLLINQRINVYKLISIILRIVIIEKPVAAIIIVVVIKTWKKQCEEAWANGYCSVLWAPIYTLQSLPFLQQTPIK